MSTHVSRRLLLLGVPAAVALLLTTHTNPLQPSVFAALVDRADWWLTLHVLQLPLLGLLGLAVYRLTSELTGPLVTVSRAALAVFAVFYSAFDAAAGVASGILIRYGRTLPADEQATLEGALQVLFNNLVTDSLAGVGTIAWTVAGVSAALALSRAGRSRVATALIGVGVLTFGVSHAPPVGPLGMVLFLAGAALLELRVHRGLERTAPTRVRVRPGPSAAPAPPAAL